MFRKGLKENLRIPILLNLHLYHLVINVIMLLVNSKCDIFVQIESDPCDAHVTLNDEWRHVSNSEPNSNCDTRFAAGWYRVDFNGRPASIPSICIKVYKT